MSRNSKDIGEIGNRDKFLIDLTKMLDQSTVLSGPVLEQSIYDYAYDGDSGLGDRFLIAQSYIQRALEDEIEVELEQDF